MATENNIVPTQLRLSAEMHLYIKKESDRLGISQNAFITILLEQGKKIWEAKTIIYQESQ